MTSFKRLRVLSYNLLRNDFIQTILVLLAKIFLKIEKNHTKKIVAITIDVESGYLKRNNVRLWIDDKPDAFEGYLFGLENLLKIAKKYKIKFTFLLSTQCFSFPSNISKKVQNLLKQAYREGHEIGLHLHPKQDLCLQEKIKMRLDYAGSSYYAKEEIDKFLRISKKIIQDNLGREISKNLKSFRWGNWAMDKRVFQLLEENGFEIDTTSCPGIEGHKGSDKHYDWRELKRNKPKIITKNLLGVPITTFWFFGQKRANPIWGNLLIECLRKTNFITVTTHSSECTYKNGKPTYVLEYLERFIMEAIKNGFKFLTLKQLKEHFFLK